MRARLGNTSNAVISIDDVDLGADEEKERWLLNSALSCNAWLTASSLCRVREKCVQQLRSA